MEKFSMFVWSYKRAFHRISVRMSRMGTGILLLPFLHVLTSACQVKNVKEEHSYSRCEVEASQKLKH